jgi:hypothetical protein
MKIFSCLATLGVCMLLAGGCSEKTKTETKEALKESGEAAGSAAEDAKVNAKKAVNVLKKAGEEAKEEFSERPAKPGEAGSDADSVPESQENKP